MSNIVLGIKDKMRMRRQHVFTEKLRIFDVGVLGEGEANKTVTQHKNKVSNHDKVCCKVKVRK